MLLPKIGSYPIFIPFIIIFPLVFYYITRKKSEFKLLFFKYVNVVMIILCLHQIILLFLTKANHKQFELNPISFNIKNVPKKTPSIHLIIWDSYPGFYTLEKHFSFNNKDLKNYLEKDGYFVQDSIQSNYFQTQHSVNSVLNLQYLPYLEQYKESVFNKRFYIIQQIDDNYLVKFLKKQDYHIHNNSIFTLDKQNKKGEILSAQNGNYFHFRGIFHKKIIADIGWNFGLGKYKINYFYNKIIMNQHYTNQSTIQFLLSHSFEKKHFTYSHIIMPHEPYYTDSLGNLIDAQKALEVGNKTLFINYLKYTNKIMKKIVQHLKMNEPNSIIILMSDHGFRSLGKEQTENLKCNNFMAIYLPDQDFSELKKIKSNVNLFRALLNQYFNQNFDLLEDKQIWIDE